MKKTDKEGVDTHSLFFTGIFAMDYANSLDLARNHLTPHIQLVIMMPVSLSPSPGWREFSRLRAVDHCRTMARV